MARRRRPCLTISLVCLVCCGRRIGAPRRDGRDETSDGGVEEVEEEAVEIGVCAHDGDLVRTSRVVERSRVESCYRCNRGCSLQQLPRDDVSICARIKERLYC